MGFGIDVEYYFVGIGFFWCFVYFVVGFQIIVYGFVEGGFQFFDVFVVKVDVIGDIGDLFEEDFVFGVVIYLCVIVFVGYDVVYDVIFICFRKLCVVLI